VLCSYENETGFENRCGDRRACSAWGWLLLLAYERSAFLQVGARCSDWFCPGDRRVFHLVANFIYRPDAIASITSCIECSADQADHVISRLNRQ
jgi:hypothetical protein